MQIVLDAGSLAWSLTAIITLIGLVAGGLWRFGKWIITSIDARAVARDDELRQAINDRIDPLEETVVHMDSQLTEHLTGYRPLPRWPRQVT